MIQHGVKIESKYNFKVLTCCSFLPWKPSVMFFDSNLCHIFSLSLCWEAISPSLALIIALMTADRIHFVIFSGLHCPCQICKPDPHHTGWFVLLSACSSCCTSRTSFTEATVSISSSICSSDFGESNCFEQRWAKCPSLVTPTSCWCYCQYLCLYGLMESKTDNFISINWD